MAEKLIIETIEAHAEGEGGRVITNMAHLVKGETMKERFDYCEANLDWFRHAILHEPRGYPALCAVFILPAVNEGSDFGIIVLEQGGFTAMSGSNTMCAVTAALEKGIVKMQEPETTVTIDTAVGTISVLARCKDGKVLDVAIRNVPAFTVYIDKIVDVPEYGPIPVDLVFGGQFFAQTNIANVGLEIKPENAKAITRAGAAIKFAVNQQLQFEHPENPSINKVGIVILHNGDREPGKQARNSAVLTGDNLTADPETWKGMLDRSPCGTGTSARMSGLYTRGQLAIGEEFSHMSFLGTKFFGQVNDPTKIGQYEAVVPTIRGSAWVTGVATWEIDPTDPFQTGYTLGDIW
jgi:proline racemase